jgi:hypothetical protein
MGIEREKRARTEGLSAERIARNDAIFRHANESIRAAAEEYGVGNRIPFFCECADPVCREIIQMSIEDYREVRSNPRHFVNAEGHEAAGQGWVEVVSRTDGHVVVEKLGEAGEVAEQLEGEDNPASAPVERSDDPSARSDGR